MDAYTGCLRQPIERGKGRGGVLRLKSRGQTRRRVRLQGFLGRRRVFTQAVGQAVALLFRKLAVHLGYNAQLRGPRGGLDLARNYRPCFWVSPVKGRPDSCSAPNSE